MAAFLAAPTILGPVSACNTTVWLDNLVVLPGVQFEVLLGANVVASGVVTHTRMEVHLQQPLKPGDHLGAQQHGPGFQAAPTPSELVVVVASAPAPSDISYPVLRTHLYDCAYCAVFDGVYPGATVTVYDAHDNVVGLAPGIGGTAIVEFTRDVTKNQKPSFAPTPLRGGPPKAMQLACGSMPGPMLPLPELEAPPIGLGGVLLDPRLGALRFGQTALELSALVPGAQLDVRTRRGNVTTSQTLCASGDVGVLHGLEGLQLGDSVQVRQTMAPCRTQGEWATAFVRDLPPPIPKLPTTLCSTSPIVHIEGLVPDSLVELVIGSVATVLGWATGNSYDMPLPDGVADAAFNAGAKTVSARAMFVAGGATSDASVPAQLVGTEAFGEPSIVTPVHACGSLVRVTGVEANRFVGIEANDSKVAGVWFVIGTAWSTDTKVDVPVNAAFMSLQLRPFELGCGYHYGPTVKAPITPFLTTLPSPPEIRENQILDCGSIHLSNVVPGAQVDLYQEHWGGFHSPSTPYKAPAPLFTRTWLGTYTSATSTLSVIRPHQVKVDDTVVAQQRICGATSALSAPAAVVSGNVVRKDIPTNMCELASNQATANLSIGTDLGVPVEFNGSLYLFFGDAGLWGGALASQCQGQLCKPIFRVLRNAHGCLASSPLACGELQKLTVDSGLSPLDIMEVPSGAFSYDGKFYLFITKGRNGTHMTDSFLVSATGECQVFHEEGLIDTATSTSNNDLRSLRFINVCPVIVKNADWPGLPATTGDGLLLFGTGQYGSSDVFLAWAPLTPGTAPSVGDWQFCTNAGTPSFQPGDIQNVLSDKQAPLAGLTKSNTWREISVAWIPGLNRWLMLPSPNAPGFLPAFCASEPWGPWTRLSPDLWSSADNAVTQMQEVSGVYGNYIVGNSMEWDAGSDTASVELVVSFNNIGQAASLFYGTYLLRVEVTCE